MRIGMDLDDTVCKTSESLNKLARKYAVEEGIEMADIFMRVSERKKFLKKYFVQVIKEAELKDGFKEVYENFLKKHDLYIITARSDEFMPHSTKVDYVTLEWLEENDIHFKGYHSDSYKEEKARICEEYKIDVMIDDDFANYEVFKKYGIKTILFDDKNMYPEVKDRVTSWEELGLELNKMKEKKDM